MKKPKAKIYGTTYNGKSGYAVMVFHKGLLSFIPRGFLDKDKFIHKGRWSTWTFHMDSRSSTMENTMVSTFDQAMQLYEAYAEYELNEYNNKMVLVKKLP